MFKVEIISTDNNRIMCEKDILYTDSLEKARKFVDERVDMETRNDFVFIEETDEWAIVQININDFYINNEKARWNDFLEIWRIIEENYTSEAINSYLENEEEI